MKNPILLAVPFFFLLMGLEWLYGYIKKKELYRLNDTITNLSHGIGNQLFGALFKVAIVGIYYWISEHYAFFKIPFTWWSFLLCLVFFDFLFYWAHRISHESNFFWGAHVVHHQSEEYNLSVALRQSWFHNMIAFFIFLPIPFLGFDFKTFGLAAAINTISQFWIHTQTISKLPKWFEYIFNTPSHHRVHHATNPKYIDKNHGGMFIIFDRLFGTFKEEEKMEEITYGITTPLNSWNPTWGNVHYYKEMFDKAKLMTKFSDKLKLIFAKPGWLPAELGGMQPLQERSLDYQKYDADTTLTLKLYCAFQFLLTLVGSISYLSNFSHISVFYRWVFLGIIILTVMIIGAIFENKKWGNTAEFFRWLLVLAGLISFYYYWYAAWLPTMIAVCALGLVLSAAWFVFSLLSDRKNTIETSSDMV